jgi:hypothetical protein
MAVEALVDYGIDGFGDERAQGDFRADIEDEAADGGTSFTVA